MRPAVNVAKSPTSLRILANPVSLRLSKSRSETHGNDMILETSKHRPARHPASQRPGTPGLSQVTCRAPALPMINRHDYWDRTDVGAPDPRGEPFTCENTGFLGADQSGDSGQIR